MSNFDVFSEHSLASACFAAFPRFFPVPLANTLMHVRLSHTHKTRWVSHSLWNTITASSFRHVRTAGLCFCLFRARRCCECCVGVQRKPRKKNTAVKTSPSAEIKGRSFNFMVDPVTRQDGERRSGGGCQMCKRPSPRLCVLGPFFIMFWVMEVRQYSVYLQRANISSNDTWKT